MKLVEQHLIRKTDPRYGAIDRAAFASKNLYNQANYHICQAFIHEGRYLSYAEIFHRLKHHEAYCALPRKVSNSILIQLDKNWKSFFKAMEAYKTDPSKFLRRPKLPKYKDKEHGRNILVYDLQALSKRALKQGIIAPSGLQKAEEQATVDLRLRAALDLGVNTLAAVTSTKRGFQPLLMNGRPLKSLNQHYNKQRAHHQSQLAKANRFSSRQLDRITTTRKSTL